MTLRIDLRSGRLLENGESGLRKVALVFLRLGF